jgi:hypothetical protein
LDLALLRQVDEYETKMPILQSCKQLAAHMVATYLAFIWKPIAINEM